MVMQINHLLLLIRMISSNNCHTFQLPCAARLRIATLVYCSCYYPISYSSMKQQGNWALTLNWHRKSVHCVEIIDQENHLLLRKIREAINIHNRQPEWTVIRAPTFRQFMEQFCSPIETRLQITVPPLMKGPGWVPKVLLNFQQIVGVKEYFLQLS